MRGRGILQVRRRCRQAYSHGEGESGVNEDRETSWDVAAPITHERPARLAERPLAIGGLMGHERRATRRGGYPRPGPTPPFAPPRRRRVGPGAERGGGPPAPPPRP